MKKSLSLLALVLTLGLSTIAMDAEAARRMGSGKSFGMQRQNTTQTTPANTPNQAPASSAAAAPAAGAAAGAAGAASKRSWMGPIAGIAAGLGLAALASHLGFGAELANMLMIGLLVMAGLAVVGFIMRKRAAAQNPGAQRNGAMNYAGAGQSPSNVRPFESAMPAGGSSGGSMIGANLAPASRIPADFDVPAFVRNAKVNFIRLQAANDSANLDDIRQFTTPEMYAEIKMEIDERGAAPQQTEVVSVNAQVLEVVEENNAYVVSVRFTGLIREEADAQPEAYDEIWHLSKPIQGQGGWTLAGIQQVA